jgi:hypothetical protein
MRDTQASPFAEILRSFIQSHPGVIGASLVDSEGETVDYSGIWTPYELRVLGAVLQVTEKAFRSESHLLGEGELLAFSFVFGSRCAFYRNLPDGYGLAMVLNQADPALIEPDSKPVDHLCLLLAVEAGWLARDATPTSHWFPVGVLRDPQGKPEALVRIKGPLALDGRDSALKDRRSIHVLGSFLEGVKTGVRVQLDHGVECNLSCESDTTWYADLPPETLFGAIAGWFHPELLPV